jgi:ACS family glucarate transporter-like MFS transporter
VGLLCATATAAYLCRVNITVAGALAMEELRLSQVQMGWVFGAFGLAYAIFMTPGGFLADRWRTRRMMELASWWWVGTTALQMLVGRGVLAGSVASTLGMLLALRFLLGVGQAPTFPAAARCIARWVARESRARANGFVIASIALGSVIAPPLVSVVMVRWGWRVALGVSALPALATALGWRFAGEPATPDAEPSLAPTQEASAALLRTRSFVLLTLSYSLQGYVGYIFVYWFYLYLVQERHFDLLKGAFLSTLPWVLSIGAIPLGGWLSDRIAGRWGLVVGRRAVPLVALALAGGFLSLGARAANGYSAAVCLALSTALVLCVEGPFWATATEIAGGRSGLAGGIMNTGCNIGGLVSPALTPVLAAAIGWENALHVAAALAVVAAVLWLGIDPLPVKRRQAP